MDLSAYNAALEEVLQANYTLASWAAYQAIVNGNVVTEQNTQDEVNTATQAISTAQIDLVLKTDVSYLEKNGELTSENNYTTTFNWGSIIGVGEIDEKPAGSPGGYSYYTDGAFLRFTLKNEDNVVVSFYSVFGNADSTNDTVGAMTLKTNEGNVNDMDGSTRERTDWGVAGINNPTNLPNYSQNTPSLFYGLIQNSTDGTKTVGFNPSEERTITMQFNPQSGAVSGTYTILVEVVQQGSGEVLDTIEYTITLN